MYTKYPNYRFGGKVRLPENYSGSAFMSGDAPNESELEKESAQESAEIENIEGEKANEPEKKQESEVSLIKRQSGRLGAPLFGFDAFRLFSRGFGFEELLLVALIILVSQGEGDDELILLLALLLFVK